MRSSSARPATPGQTTANGQPPTARDSRWRLRIDSGEVADGRAAASVLAVGNGRLGVRGADPLPGRPSSNVASHATAARWGREPADSATTDIATNPIEPLPHRHGGGAGEGAFLSGLFDPLLKHSAPPETPQDSPALAPLPDPFAFHFTIDGEAPDGGETLEESRELDLRRGLLVCHRRLRLRSGGTVSFTVEQGASAADRRLLLQRIAITPEQGGRGELAAELSVDAVPAFERLPALVPEDGAPAGVVQAHTPRSGLRVALAQRCTLHGDAAPIAAEQTREQESGRLVDRLAWQAAPGQTAVVERVIAVCSSREAAAPAAAAVQAIASLPERGLSALLTEHTASRERRWRDSDLRIDGDEAAQRALRWSVHQLISAADPEDERVSLGARLLSGPGYQGHVFWDAEIYLLPFYTFTWPEAARALLRYRYHTLEVARLKAARLGYRGALYAWESALSGHEATARFRFGPHGERIPIYTGERGHHISADVAYAVWQYWQATGDDAFFRDCGVEIVLETARFWAGRARLEDDRRYHIRGVIGPDEFHEQVDDSAYTNALARLNLELGRAADAWLRRTDSERHAALHRRLALGARELERWDDVAARLAVDLAPRGGVIEQFAGYFALEDATPEKLAPPGTKLQDAVGLERLRQTQVIKQADVVLLCHLLAEAVRPETAAACFDYYEPRCAHASSLSPSIYALVAARLGRGDQALRLFRQAADIDLRASGGRAVAGVHAANCGGLWQAAVFGVAGMRLTADGLAFAPNLLPGWGGLAFSVRWRGCRLDVAIRRAPAQIRFTLSEGDGPICLRLPGQPPLRLRGGETVELALPATAWNQGDAPLRNGRANGER